VFSLKRRIALSFAGESCMGLSPLFLRMSFIDGVDGTTGLVYWGVSLISDGVSVKRFEHDVQDL
jgi:hypothetical protein